MTTDSSSETSRSASCPMAGLRCPHCHASLRLEGEKLLCTGVACAASYPVVNGIPILLDESKSVFSISDYTSPAASAPEPEISLARRLRMSLPGLSRNVLGTQNYTKFAELLKQRSARPRVLVLGGRILGAGMELFANDPSFELVETDVAFGPRTRLICDAHDVPFEDGSFDAIIIQAVLEHVCDPYRCVAEVHRVLKPQGMIYAETPFMQQVHAAAWDFTRFTDLGHRRLFRQFESIAWGPVGGPGMALAWAWQYFLISFTTNRIARAGLRIFSELTSFWLKYLDGFIINTPGTRDAASGYYFMGYKSDKTLSDRELIGLYKGAQ